MVVFVDIETRSRADLPEVGAYRYGCDPSTEVMMMAVTTGQPAAPIHLWVNPLFDGVAGITSDPKALELLSEATEVYAHNANFELAVLQGVGFEPWISLDRWRCTAAMARMAGLPASLEKCAEKLDLVARKDSRGKGLIRLFSIPQADGTFAAPADHPDKWAEFVAYCRQDVEVERQIKLRLEKGFTMAGITLAGWQFTLRLNQTGIPVNVTALKNAKRIVDEVTHAAREEFQLLTGVSITQREKVRQWLNERGAGLNDMRSETLAGFSMGDNPTVSRAVDLYRQLSFAAVRKIDTMLNWVMPDGRMRGVFTFYGTNTGRWSAGGPQLQNIKKAGPRLRKVTGPAYEAISNGATAGEIDAVYGDPVEVVASAMRHFVHAPGQLMLDADYNAIEARIACWICGEKGALADYATGKDRYRVMAAKIFDVPEHAVTGDQRDLGKQAILGLAYGMGAEKFRTSCEARGMHVSADLAIRTTRAFRSAHPRIANMWKQLDNSMREVMARAHTRFVEVGAHVAMRVYINAGKLYLYVRLPSGRTLAYPEPEFKGGNFSYGGVLPMSTQWGRINLYGAKLFENICQAVAADLMLHGAINAEDKWMLPVALIHDQALAIQMDESQTPKLFADALSQLPSWATGLPLKAEAKLTKYYTK